jgi:hypothetical protein
LNLNHWSFEKYDITPKPMKKLFIYYIMICFFTACGSKEEILVLQKTQKQDSIPTQPNTDTSLKTDTVISVKPPDPIVVPTNNLEKVNLIFKLNFNTNAVGAYKEGEWNIDWKNPEWANNALGYGKIVQEGTNRVLSQSYPAGSFLAAEGYQWHAKFSQGYNELYLSYKVKFSSGFTNRNLHGKLPGLSGGTSNGGGNLPTGKNGWSGRYMFHGTSIKFYLYYPDLYKVYGDVKPVAGKLYYGNGPTLNPGFTLKTGVWYTVTQRIVMNTPGKADGLVEGFIDGKLCASQKGIRFRDVSTLMIDRIYFANFFGGSGEPPSKTESISFDDFVVYTYKTSVNVARNNTSNAAGTVIPIPLL